jgi:hypothetical protein
VHTETDSISSGRVSREAVERRDDPTLHLRVETLEISR